MEVVSTRDRFQNLRLFRLGCSLSDFSEYVPYFALVYTHSDYGWYRYRSQPLFRSSRFLFRHISQRMLRTTWLTEFRYHSQWFETPLKDSITKQFNRSYAVQLFDEGRSWEQTFLTNPLQWLLIAFCRCLLIYITFNERSHGQLLIQISIHRV